VAFVTSDGPAITNTQSVTVTGGGLTWTRVQRAGTRNGVSEIWTARAATALANITVTSTQAAVSNFAQSLTVVSFTGVSAIGASSAGGAATGAPTLSLVAQAAGSLVFGVGNDWDTATARTLGAGQSMVHQFLAPVGDTFWVERATAATTAVGQTVTLNSTAPTADQWNFAMVELRP
jgi:hypothetical protein